jgi:putative phosphoesterase
MAARSKLRELRVGIIADTHGMLRADVHRAFQGVTEILHAGDVLGNEILDELELIAPVRAVRGNCDDPWDPRLPERLETEIGGLSVHMSHGHELGRPKPAQVAAAYSADICIYGHTHKQRIERVDGRLVINPGAAGERRYDLPPCVAILTIRDGEANAELIELAE